MLELYTGFMLRGMGGCVVPADGVKGKTWGPSTCHQRERGQIMSRVAGHGAHKRWSKSAPNLEKPSRPLAQIGEHQSPEE